MSVSYTHLDVYKRQFLARLLRVEQDGRFVLEDEGGSEREYLFKEVPVSYTHLDVYKRQEQNLAYISFLLRA